MSAFQKISIVFQKESMLQNQRSLAPSQAGTMPSPFDAIMIMVKPKKISIIPITVIPNSIQ